MRANSNKDSYPQFIWGSKKTETFFRRRFVVPEQFDRAVVRLFVDTGYELYLNGQFVVALDEMVNTRDYDVTPFLDSGENLIAVRAINHGGHKGLACEVRFFSGAAGSSIVSDSSWKIASDEIWEWKTSAFNDEHWAYAHVLPFVHLIGGIPWKSHAGEPPSQVIPCLSGSSFALGDIPKFVPSPFFKAERMPMAATDGIQDIVGSDYESGMADYPPELAIPSRLVEAAPGNGSATGPEGVMDPHGTPVVVGAVQSQGGPSFVIDFGLEVVGFLRMRLLSEGHVHFSLLFGEILEECYTRPPLDESLVGKMVSEEIVLCPGSHEWECRRRQGFRFVRLTFHDCSKPVRIGGMSLRMSLYPVVYQGFFSCSDPLLNSIWRVGRRTLHLCMQEYYLDGIKRDRLLWVADARVEALANYYVFGDVALFKFCWTQFEKSQYPDGAIPATLGEGQSVLWDFTAWWIVALADYHLYCGDLEFLRIMRNGVVKAADWLMGLSDPLDGLIAIPVDVCPGWFYTLYGRTGKDHAFNSLVLRALTGAAGILNSIGEAQAAKQYLAHSLKMQEFLQKVQPPPVNYVTLAGAVEGMEVTEGLFRQGNVEKALNFIRGHWSPIIKSGGTTFWEMIHYNGNSGKVDERQNWSCYDYGSHCHGWSSWPVYSLLADVAGVRPLQPGFKTFQVKPQLGDLSHLKGVVPTPVGPVALAITRDCGCLTLRLDIPKGSIAVISLPNPTGSDQVLVDGRRVSGVQEKINSGDGERLVLTMDVSGIHSFQIPDGII